ncbi:trehalase-like isoform X2 [Ptychodera flava]|uniref:trehalase-like isoform X2 n=1 Tax=Ptychodera flava TaxID=63121 RepID=UPI00396A5A64
MASFKFVFLHFIVALGCSIQQIGCQDLKDMPPCYGWPQDKIYCYGDLLHDAQMANIHTDSKSYVDMNLKDDPETVVSAYEALTDPSNEEMKDFVDEYYDGPGEEFEDWDPQDWKENPAFLSDIADDDYREFASDLNALWKELGRQIKIDVNNSQERYSLIYVDEPFIVPGGRFREFYYWDSYWVINGLLISEMYTTVKGMLKNFVQMVDTVGFVPNGGRIYYTRRSQPALLIPMVKRYLDVTGDTEFVESILPSLEKEYHFWMDNRTVTIDGHSLSQYNVWMGMPRPESYREDVETASEVTDPDEKAQVYSDIASAAESGWDFSSRWFEGATLDTIRTTEIIPIDLNSILCMNERILSELYELTDDTAKSEQYKTAYDDRVRAINEVMWDNNKGAWFDYDLTARSRKTDKFYLSSVAPLWAGCYDGDAEKEQKVLDYLQDEEVLNYYCGVPTSKTESGEQWDYPNAWPPLQEMVITGLAQSSLSEAQDMALTLAHNWTYCNWKTYEDSEDDYMYEKYDVRHGAPGGGGEYDVQLGFGWTNGVIIQLLKEYGDVLKSDPVSSATMETASILMLACTMMLQAVHFFAM